MLRAHSLAGLRETLRNLEFVYCAYRLYRVLCLHGLRKAIAGGEPLLILVSTVATVYNTLSIWLLEAAHAPDSECFSPQGENTTVGDFFFRCFLAKNDYYIVRLATKSDVLGQPCLIELNFFSRGCGND